METATQIVIGDSEFSAKNGDHLAWAQYFHANNGGREAIVKQFADNWARYMDHLMRKGQTLEEVWFKTYEELNAMEDLSNHALGKVIDALVKYWEYGEALEKEARKYFTI